MALTCGNFAGKSRCYALVVLFVANAPRWSDAVAFTPEPGQYVGSAQPPARNEVPCLSHVPKKMCVVAHHCSHKKEKEELVALARDLGLLRDATTFPHRRELPARGGFRSACSPEFARIVFHESARSRNISRGTSVLLHGGGP